MLIDEAQDLGIGVLEELRLLSNLETAKEKILQFVLAGQPELDAMLERRELRQLRQRIAVFARLRPLARGELEAYVAARIEAAGGSARDLFSRPALRRLWRFSRGVPRLVNVAGDNALVTAYAAGRKRVGWRAVGEAVSDLRPARFSVTRRRRRLRAGALAVAAALGIVLGVVVSRLTAKSSSSLAPVAPERAPAAAVAGGEAISGATGSRDSAGEVGGSASEARGSAGAVASSADEKGGSADEARGSADETRARASADEPSTVGATERRASESPEAQTASIAPDVGSAPANPVADAASVASADAPSHAPVADAPSANAVASAGPADADHASSAARGDGEPSPDGSAATDADRAPLASVRVEEGDTLTYIVRRYYGHDSPALLMAVRRANPGIADPDMVLVGQTVWLPDLPREQQAETVARPAPARRRHVRRGSDPTVSDDFDDVPTEPSDDVPTEPSDAD